MFLRRLPLPRAFRAPIRRTFTSRPWFVSPDDEESQVVLNERVPPLPEDTPDHVRQLHATLSTLPYLDTSYLTVTRPIEPLPAPPLPKMAQKGRRRRRGGTDFGVGIDMPMGGIWNWYILAQVKEGAENRGSIQSVMRTVRDKLRELAMSGAMVQVPFHRRRLSTEGWEMLDAGDLAVHVISREAREKWFSNI